MLEAQLTLRIELVSVPADGGALARIESLLQSLTQGVATMAVDLSALEAQVQANTDAESSAVLLLTQLSDLIRQNAADPAKVAELADKLKASAAALSAAIVANTPAA